MDDPNFKACALAVFNRKSVHFSYRDAGGQHSERTVDVWGIGQRYGQWYFTGYDHTRNERRVFRLSRITGSFTLSTLPKGSTYHPRPEVLHVPGAAGLRPAAPRRTGHGAHPRRGGAAAACPGPGNHASRTRH
ncbi:helix-turn-helix transcriptional regulator, partial [Arthrobacter sp. JCM 19049]|uniref:helix-turn-helix transcriptional regulator n=1 Tax=Arthrobacter sp. JCM 19049 TaxID=1460643 RepID=UPI0035B54BE1